jgi:hypothetical protein
LSAAARFLVSAVSISLVAFPMVDRATHWSYLSSVREGPRYARQSLCWLLGSFGCGARGVRCRRCQQVPVGALRLLSPLWP